MDYLEQERIQRILYKQEQKKLEEERKKYPALYGQIKNIKDYFYFNDIGITKEEEKKDDKTSSTKLEYNIYSFCDNEETPDLYTPYGKISGDNYELTQIVEINNNLNYKNNTNIKKDSNKFIPKTNPPKLSEGKINNTSTNFSNETKFQNGLETTQSNNDEKNNNNNINNNTQDKSPFRNIRQYRYFDLDFDFPEIKLNSKNELILPNRRRKKSRSPFFKKRRRTVSKYNTSSINSLNFCYICLSLKHSLKTECPIYKRCYKCLKYGHWAKSCKEELKNLCEYCGISVHKKEDCLRCHKELKSIDILVNKKDLKLKCAFCESRKHLICPFSMRENFVINIENKHEENQNGGTKDYSKILFCPYCAGNHLKTECKEKQKDKENIFQDKNIINNNVNNNDKDINKNKDSIKNNFNNKENKGNKENNNIPWKNDFINRKREINKNENQITKRKSSNFSWANQSNNYDNTNNNRNKPFEINWSSNTNNNNSNRRNDYKNNYYKKDYSKYRNNYQYNTNNNSNTNNKYDYNNNNNYNYNNKSRISSNDIYNKHSRNDNYKTNNNIINISNNNIINLEEDNRNDDNTQNIYGQKKYETYDYFAERRKMYNNYRSNGNEKRFERSRSKYPHFRKYKDYRNNRERRERRMYNYN